jgi:hypothetical protein
LQTLAILGREFVLSLARAVAGKSEDELERLLMRVMRSSRSIPPRWTLISPNWRIIFRAAGTR